MRIHDEEHQKRSEHTPDTVALVLPLTTLNRTLLPLVGGKAANLGELIRAGFAVPGGFCVTTAAYARVSASIELDSLLAELAGHQRDEPSRLAELAAAARAAVRHASIPTEVVIAITAAYQALSNGKAVPVAVRSSATAEDLPTASFAGQQETYLNIVGVEAVLTAIQHCWASLWTERAVSYRHSLGIDPRTVRLAVVVQHMVDAQVAGVLFTANPLTGTRRQAVIEANPGLGEAVVSGATNPDHFVVNATTGEIVQRHLGDKHMVIHPTPDGGIQRAERAVSSDAACLADTHVHALAALGARVEAHFGSPQDIEWAIDAADQIFLLQARPITTLFPLPVEAPSTDAVLRVYLSFNVQQGTYRPFTPMGISVIRLIASGIATFAGFPPRNPLAGPRFVVDAACRLFVDVTMALRTSFGRALLLQMMAQAEVHAATIFQQLVTDPRLSLVKISQRSFVRTLGRLLIRSRMLWYLLQALRSPKAAHARMLRLVTTLRAAGQVAANADAAARLAAIERILFRETPCLLFRVSPVMIVGMQTFALAKRLLRDLASESECQVVLRGSPSNPTIEMNLALWALAEQVRTYPAAARLIQDIPAAQLAADYRTGSLPSPLQHGLARFLAIYGHQGIAELDLGMPRWAEDPTYVLGVLASYLALHEPARSPVMQFQRAAQDAEAMVTELTRRAAHQNWLRGRLVGFCLRRARALAGSREMPRFVGALLLSQARAHLGPIGAELAQAGRLEHADDIFFLALPEVHTALAGSDPRAEVSERRAIYAQELTRHRVPLVLLSDGSAPTAERNVTGSARNTFQGTPASPGIVTATARVILDPHDAHLAPGEILVAPTTDPGWTPLFLSASGLVLEMGGTMAHGAIVAREYGIPAVVGVAGATERITSGSRITIDGTSGCVTVVEGV